MELIQFTEKVKNALEQYYGETAKIESQTVCKNNGLVLHGICVMKENHTIAPTIYLNRFWEQYEGGSSFGAIIQNLIKISEEHQVEGSINMDFFLDYEQVKHKLVYRLIHREKNRELLKEVPYREFGDLAIVCHCLILSDVIGNGTILIYKSHLEDWNINEETLFQDAGKNSPRLQPYRIQKMREIVREALSRVIRGQIEEIGEEYACDREALLERSLDEMLDQMENANVSMYVLSNEIKYFGAACLCYEGMLELLGNWIGSDYYILPSSVHEVILLSKAESVDQGNLSRMVREVNEMQVDKEEWLSDHAYLYKRKSKELVIL